MEYWDIPEAKEQRTVSFNINIRPPLPVKENMMKKVCGKKKKEKKHLKEKAEQTPQ